LLIQFLYPRRGAKDAADDSDSDDDISLQSPDTITTPVAPVRKARRRTLTLEKSESQIQHRTRERAKSPAETESSGNEIDDEDGLISKDSSKTSLPTTENSSLLTFEISNLSTSPIPSVSPPLTVPRSSMSTAPPRYILRKAFKRIKLQNPLPPVMILHLKRFYGTETGSMKKLDDFVSFETEFDFAPFVFPPSPKKSKMLYRLTGVVIHLGSINSGQYLFLMDSILIIVMFRIFIPIKRYRLHQMWIRLRNILMFYQMVSICRKENLLKADGSGCMPVIPLFVLQVLRKF
jgi:hypothetical protein